MKAVLLLACFCFLMSFAAPVFACYTIDDASISKVDTEKKTLVVKKGEESKTFTTADKTVVTVNGKAAKLADLKSGDKVTIDYEAADDVLRVKATRES